MVFFIDNVLGFILYTAFFCFLLCSYQRNFVFCNRTLLYSKQVMCSKVQKKIELWENELKLIDHEYHNIYDDVSTCTLHVLNVYSTVPTDNTFMFCHGNSGNVSTNIRKAIRIMQETSSNVILFDYAGYGLSTGKCFSEYDMFTNALTVYEKCFTFPFSRLYRTRCFLYGVSLGGFVAMMLAVHLHQKCWGIIIENSMYSLQFVLKTSPCFRFLQLLPLFSSLCMRDILKNVDIDLPVIILSSKHDNILSEKNSLKIYNEMQKLYMKHVTYVQFFDPDITHTNAWKLHSRYFEYFNDIVTFNTV